MIAAGVDIGTLTCRLLIAEVIEGRLSPLHSERRILCLGEGVDQHRRLQPAAMKRVIDTLREWRGVIRHYRAVSAIAVATSAVRDATNRDEFRAMVAREAGFDIEIITGEEEARRTLLGIRSGLSRDPGDILGLDIGGGSTELIVDRRDRPPAMYSLELGVVRLTERVFQHDPPSATEMATAHGCILELVRDIRPRLGDLSHLALVGTAGSITTLAAMALRLPVYEAAQVHGFALDLQVIQGLEHELVSRPKAQRRELPGLEAGREEVIVAGTLILRTIMEALGFQICLVSDMGLREGMLIDLAQRLQSTHPVELPGRQPAGGA